MLLDARIVVLPVHDLEMGRRWYTEVLRFAPYRATEHEVAFNGGGYDLRLVLVRRRSRPKAPTVYWRVANLVTALRRLKLAGATLQCPLENAGPVGLTAAVWDPFGNILGLVQESAERGIIDSPNSVDSSATARTRVPRPLIRLA